MEIWGKLYGKELNCKKNILEYIDTTRLLKKGNVTEEQLKDTYNYIYQHIEGKISPGFWWITLSYINREFLKNNLKLDCNQKKDIVDVIKMLVKKNNIKYINNLRSLKRLSDELDISIVSVGKGFTLARKE